MTVADITDAPFYYRDVIADTAEHIQLRCGRITSTRAAKVLSQPRKGMTESVGRADMRLRLAVERITGVTELSEFDNEWTLRGRDLEPQALATYEAYAGFMVERCAFVSRGPYYGTSPDGLVGSDGGVEIKCPKATTHVKYLTEKRLPPEYVSQVRHHLFVTGRTWWDFCSFCPNLPEASRVFLVRALASDFDMAAYELATRLFLSDVETTVNTLNGGE